MKQILATLFSSKATALLIVLGSLAGITNASAQTVYLTFSGGNNNGQVTITWASPIVYTIANTSLISGVNPIFVFHGIPNMRTIFPNQAPVGVGAPTYSSTGVGSTDGVQTVNRLTTPPNSFNSVTVGDMVFFSNNDTAPTILTSGDVITLSAGSLSYDGSPTSNAGYLGALPTDGYYSTFVTDGADTYYTNLGSGVSAVPEPSTYAMFAGLGMLGFAAWRRRKSVTAQVAA